MGQHLLPLEQLGAPARALRAFRRLLFLEAAQVEGSPLLRELPRPEVLHHLYSRAPPQLESPHARSGLTPAQARNRGREVGRGVAGSPRKHKLVGSGSGRGRGQACLGGALQPPMMPPA